MHKSFKILTVIQRIIQHARPHDIDITSTRLGCQATTCVLDSSLPLPPFGKHSPMAHCMTVEPPGRRETQCAACDRAALQHCLKRDRAATVATPIVYLHSYNSESNQSMHLLSHKAIEKVIHKKVLKNSRALLPAAGDPLHSKPARRRRRKISNFLCSANKKEDAFDNSRG